MSIALNGATIPTAVAECGSPHQVTAPRLRWTAIRSQIDRAADREAVCRIYAASFYELVTMRQAAAGCIHDADHGRDVAELDSEIDVFNDLLASQCSG
ncbi:hypothetical protein [Bradyrhizobium iriomotense]|nr:hypothetical protein [Bradyrhizobium iriomotense]